MDARFTEGRGGNMNRRCEDGSFGVKACEQETQLGVQVLGFFFPSESTKNSPDGTWNIADWIEMNDTRK